MPEIDLVTFLIVCPLCFLSGLVDAIAGGGGLIALPAYLIAGLPPHYAIGTSKISSAMGTTLATIQYVRHGFVPWKIALCCAVCALGASALGASLNLMLDDRYFRPLLLVVLPLTAFYVLRTKILDRTPDPYPLSKTIIMALLVTAVIGTYDGFYGPGTGTFLILLLISFSHLSLNQANGVSKVANLSTNIAALVVMLMNGKVIVPLGLAAGCFALVGSYIGVRCFTAGGAKVARPAIIIVLVIFFIKLSYELLFL